MVDEVAPSPAYQLAMLVLCVFAVLVLVIEAIFPVDPQIARVLEYADTFICVVFLGDFVYSFARAPRKLRYLVTWGWLDLLSSVPSLDLARWGRIARIARLTRVLRALRASRMITKLLVRHKGQSTAVAAALLALFLIIGCSAAILRFEDAPDANIKTADDAVWWAFTTITTVGYGDRYPMSGEGRFIAALLMTAGVGLFGAFSAALAAWFLAPEGEETNAELAALRSELAAVRKMIEERLPPQPREG
ncbi:MAG TPA: ion transporter [Thermoanaerobaculia bacterium]|jgi:voltage-gated potassium channel|nr:ion transporter [Thermoanaerobaculia bacterium]